MFPLIDRPPKEGARMLALSYLDQAIAASARLDDPKDPESLHNFRVGLRRLRTCLREYEPWLADSVRKKHYKSIRALAASTGGGRDAEVQVGWIEALGEGLGATERAGARWMDQALAHRKKKAYRKVRSKGRARLKKIDRSLRPRLARYTEEREVGGDPAKQRFGYVTAGLLLRRGKSLHDGLRTVRGIEDESRAHRARIHGKRLRYLLEPLRGQVEGAKRLVRRLRQLQDLLGNLNDLHVLSASVGEALEVAAVDRARRLRKAATVHEDPQGSVDRALRADERPGLLALLRRARQRKIELFEVLLSEWLAEGGALEGLMADVEALAARMRRDALPVEIERKYLLSAMPTFPADRVPKVTEIEQGYLPGEKLQERLRKKSDEAGARYTRCVKLGRGLRRIEVEEATTATLYKKLWPLTRGKRVIKRRHTVTEGERVWEIDEFLDRELFLAEVELPDEEAASPIPEWLARVLVREVTDEGEFVNVNLAK